MALAPGLARKVKKVLETPVDSPELLSCLRALSEFYPENTPSARRGLRRSVEKHGLQINREYLTASSHAQHALQAVDGQLEKLLDSCDRISDALESTRERTGALLRETGTLDAELKSIEERKKIVKTFAVDFQLTDEDVAALEGRDVSTSGGDSSDNNTIVITDTFFTALDRARTIHGNCKRLLRTHHQRAGLELMDQMSTYQEKAHERLCRWVQSECRLLAEDDGGGSVDETLTKAMGALKHRPTLYRYCVEEVSRTRHNALFRRFITALTRGGAGGVPRPIEAHASDPTRYVGDMLGWLHQAAAGEKELVLALLGEDGDWTNGEGDEKGDASVPSESTSKDTQDASSSQVLDRILDGVRRPFRVRVDQALTSTPGESEIVRYRLAALFHFYKSIIGKISGDDDGSLVGTLRECHSAAKDAFEQTVARRADTLKKHPPTVPADLSAPDCVTEATRRVVELLRTNESMGDAGDVDPGMGDSLAGAAVRVMLLPVVEACEVSAEMLSNDELTQTQSKHPRWAKEAFLVNCRSALRAPLKEFPDARNFTNECERKADALAKSMARDEAMRLLVRVGVFEIRTVAGLYRSGGGDPNTSSSKAQHAVMSKDPALKLQTVCSALDSLVEAVGASDEPAPSFDLVRDPAIRADARREYAGHIIEAFTTTYAMLLDPQNGYDMNQIKTAMRHGPNALSTLLGGV